MPVRGFHQADFTAGIARVLLYPWELPLSKPWVTSRGQLTVREGLLVRVELESGVCGWGDCAPLPGFSTDDLPQIMSFAEPFCSGLSGQPVGAILESLPTFLPSFSAGLETALLDAEARSAGIPLAEIFVPEPGLSLASNASLGEADAGAMDRSAAAVERGFPVLKFKLGVRPSEQELSVIRALSADLPAGVRLRLDANRAWDETTAREWFEALADLPIDGVEEPLAEPTPEGLASLQAMVPFPVAVDESLPSLPLQALFEQAAIRRLVLKPNVQGGLIRNVLLAGLAADHGVETVITTSLDSPVGVAAACQLAAALPGTAVHGLATLEIFAGLDAGALLPSAGVITLPREPGLGADAERFAAGVAEG